MLSSNLVSNYRPCFFARFFGVLLFIVTVWIIIRWKIKYSEPQIITYTHHHTDHTPVILLWTLYFNIHWRIEEGVKECARYKCYFTANKDFIHNSSAVVFHSWARHLLPDVLKAVKLAVPRPQNQRWVYMNRESPVNSPTHHFLRNWHIFNWTLTYKLDSDVVGKYFNVRPGQFQNGFDSHKDYLEEKTIEVSALISNCMYNRLKVVRSLMEHINVNLMGKCNNNRMSAKHIQLQIRRSKFYFAFENSLCLDYVTEKTYKNSYENEAVPVILSGANLSNPQIVPPGSYIDATKFKSAKELADYLKYVGSSKERYNKFFEWRDKWSITRVAWDCNLCKKLHESSPEETKVYTDLSGLYDRDECQSYNRW